MLTDVAKENWEEYKTMGSSIQNNAQVHSEIVYLEDWRLGKSQDNNTTKLGKCDAREDLK